MKQWCRTVMLCTALCLLGGCATLAPMDAGIKNLVGQSQDEAFTALGIPDSSKELDDNITVYSWENHGIGSYTVPQNNNTYASINDETFTISTTTYQTQTYTYHCKIHVAVRNKIIISYDVLGDTTGCAPYMERVERYWQERGLSFNDKGEKIPAKRLH